jgi:protein ATS1
MAPSEIISDLQHRTKRNLRFSMPLYALGSNSSYQLSLIHANDVSSPSLTTLNLPSDEEPVKIVAGANHTLLLTSKGNLYATGANKYGQCLRPPCDAIVGFVLLDGQWKDCAATWEGSVGVREDGSIWSFGRIKNHTNLAGIKLVEETTTCSNFEDSRTIYLDGRSGGNVHVVGGVQHFIAFGKGWAYGYGDARKGQFGDSTTTGTGPIKLPTSNVLQAACGKDFSCLLSQDNNIAVYTTTTKHNLHSVTLSNDFKSITSSWSTIAILHNSGKITSWGRSDRGQLPPSDLPPILQLAAGSEHFIALSHENKVYTWGWNEHGNCGLSTFEDVTFVHELVFPSDEKPVYVAAGCGTSWIWTERQD